ncbi:Thyrotropin-releasing hormone receptor [Heterocephalus glaber]|uniref:Thyrotropin-releasing hormone receptor n=1 Tax=Heterocephalus glaber TaxID=10181 RepID=G5B7R0_HETGA|nr:Thyrotropin-releasing hormone receptor [Heterocephalus glaber]
MCRGSTGRSSSAGSSRGSPAPCLETIPAARSAAGAHGEGHANASGLGTMPRAPLAVQAMTPTLVPRVCAVGVAGNATVVLVVSGPHHAPGSAGCAGDDSDPGAPRMCRGCGGQRHGGAGGGQGRHMVTLTICYLVSLAAADLPVLLRAAVPTVAEAAPARGWVFGHAGRLGNTYLQYVGGISTSTGSLTAFTVERYLAICRPLRAQALCTVARAKRLAAWMVTKMLAIVVVLFAMLQLPHQTLVVVNSFLIPPYLDFSFLLFCHLCIYLNSAVNPIVYALMSQRFLEAFHKLFQCRLAQPKCQPRMTSLFTTASSKAIPSTVWAPRRSLRPSQVLRQKGDPGTRGQGLLPYSY